MSIYISIHICMLRPHLKPHVEFSAPLLVYYCSLPEKRFAYPHTPSPPSTPPFQAFLPSPSPTTPLSTLHRHHHPLHPPLKRPLDELHRVADGKLMYSNYRMDVIDKVLGPERAPAGAVQVRRGEERDIGAGTGAGAGRVGACGGLHTRPAASFGPTSSSPFRVAASRCSRHASIYACTRFELEWFWVAWLLLCVCVCVWCICHPCCVCVAVAAVCVPVAAGSCAGPPARQ